MEGTTIKTEGISLEKLHRKYIRGTPKESNVTEKTILLCNLTSAVSKGANISSKKVYLKTRVLKHIYDKRPAQEYDLLLIKLPLIVKYPDMVLTNKGGKRGSKCLIKVIENIKYFTTIEEDGNCDGNYLVTAFKVEDKYLKNYEEIWSWEDGNLHRNTLDATS